VNRGTDEQANLDRCTPVHRYARNRKFDVVVGKQRAVLLTEEERGGTAMTEPEALQWTISAPSMEVSDLKSFLVYER